MNKTRLHNTFRPMTRNLAVLLLLTCSVFSPMLWAKPLQWQTLAPGIAYTEINVKQPLADGKIHAFEVDLANNRLAVAMASDYDEQSLYIRQFAERAKANIALNGGFFDPEKKPLGLRIDNHQTKQKLRSVSWWGVFSVRGNEAKITSMKQFKPSKKIQTALQAGPRLVINGKIPKLGGGEHSRSAICLRSANRVTLVITERCRLSTTELAQYLKRSPRRGGLGCRDALNLDGGSSSQLYANINDFDLYLANLVSISDAIVVQHQTS